MLKWPKRLILFAWFVVMVLLGAWILQENKTQVTVTFLGTELEGQSLGLVICSMLALGGGGGFITSFLLSQGKVYFHRRKYIKATKALQKLQAEPQARSKVKV
ncbi:MAG: putative integral membrane protein [Lentisphaeria bacterium]|jgi:uncharacterized integral membrane protein